MAVTRTNCTTHCQQGPLPRSSACTANQTALHGLRTTCHVCGKDARVRGPDWSQCHGSSSAEVMRSWCRGNKRNNRFTTIKEIRAAAASKQCVMMCMRVLEDIPSLVLPKRGAQHMSTVRRWPPGRRYKVVGVVLVCFLGCHQESPSLC